MSDINRLALITMDQFTGQVLLEQLNSLLGDRISIESYTTQDTIKEHVDTSVVVVSNYSLLPDVESKFTFGENTRIIYARRSIGKQGIQTLLNIPSGTRGVLFIGHSQVSRNVIQSIRHLGITHIDLIPEQTGKIDYDADMIITTGKATLLEQATLPVVDIGVLRLDIFTVFEIMAAMDMLESKYTMISAKYNRDIIDLCQDVSQALHQLTAFSKYMEITINAYRDGIVFIDEMGKIVLANQAAEQLFGLPKDKLIGTVLSQENGFPWNWQELSSLDKCIFRLNDTKLVVNSSLVETPLGPAGMMLTLRDVTEIERLEEMVRRDRASKGHIAKFTFGDIMGDSIELKSAITIAQQEARTDATILIQGESGVGKELFAQAIHNASARRKGAFVAVNFSAVTESLMESELFGYEDGAFTGARKGGKPGLFELAHGGTIFIDEIGDASPALQSRLLRVLQEKQVMRVGATKIIPVDVRVIAATNRRLPNLVEQGAFREDLYYRLNVLPLNIPPLRERSGDLEVLLKSFFTERGRQFRITPKAWHVLQNYPYPGNIRELQNIVEYICCCTAMTDEIEISCLPRYILESITPVVLKESLEEDSIYMLLDCLNPLEEHIRLLTCIKEYGQAGRTIGRRTLWRVVPGMTEARLRTRLKALQESGCVVLMSGRRGTKITQKGLALLQHRAAVSDFAL